MLLSLQASANTKILVEKADQQFVVIPDCYISEDVTKVRVSRLQVGAPIFVKHDNRQVRCTVEEYYQVQS